MTSLLLGVIGVGPAWRFRLDRDHGLQHRRSTQISDSAEFLYFGPEAELRNRD